MSKLGDTKDTTSTDDCVSAERVVGSVCKHYNVSTWNGLDDLSGVNMETMGSRCITCGCRTIDPNRELRYWGEVGRMITFSN